MAEADLWYANDEMVLRTSVPLQWLQMGEGEFSMDRTNTDDTPWQVKHRYS